MAGKTHDWLEEKAEIEERPFRSETAVVGPLIARFREMWNSVATKWYVRPLLQQQNNFNRLVVERLHDHDSRLIEQDREQTGAAHDMAALSAQVAQANRRLADLEAEVERLQAKLDSG
ncbi:MAG: hypothetical protein R3248_07905 [Candidatus Promineifilaceae bacterium]|nr:hypothetical protein [Candidatus Promineifilaceae bacterium]